MAREGVTIRPATLADAPALAAVDAASWPAGMAADDAQVRSRIDAFPPGQLVAELDGQIMGVIWTQRISADFFASSPATFDALTDRGSFTRSHDPKGEIAQLIGVATLPEVRGVRLGRLLVDEAVALHRTLPGVERILGFTRPVGYSRRRDTPIDRYVHERDTLGRLIDPMLSFHLAAGAKLVSIHPNYRPEDAEACGYGILIEYPLEAPAVGI